MVPEHGNTGKQTRIKEEDSRMLPVRKHFVDLITLHKNNVHATKAV